MIDLVLPFLKLLLSLRQDDRIVMPVNAGSIAVTSPMAPAALVCPHVQC